MMTLAEVAELLNADLSGDATLEISGLGTLAGATAAQVSFLTNSKYRPLLQQTRAAAVICRPQDSEGCPVATLTVKDPHLAFAILSQQFDIVPPVSVGIHPRAVIDPTATVAPTAAVGANVVIEAGAVLEAGVVVMANSFIGVGVHLAEHVHIWPNVTIYHGVKIGPRTNIHAAAVIGCDGFGFAFNGTGWTKVCQIGTVRIGADCDIGAGTTIDRGAIEDTVIGDHVIIDNQVHLAHNVSIGDGSALAAQVGMAGSTQVGRFCSFGGQVGIAGHIEIVDQVQVLGKTMVTGSLKKAGVYASGVPHTDYATWRKNAVRFRHLDEIAKRLTTLERRLDDNSLTE